MSRRAHLFKKFSQYGAGYIKDNLDYPVFPPFTEKELNTTEDNELGAIVVDDEGRVYMKVRYVETVADGSIGQLVSFAQPLSPITSGSEATFNSYDATTGKIKLNDATAYSKNQLKGAILLINSSAGNPNGVVREIYENDATVAGTVEVKISEQLPTYKTSQFDGNHLGGTGLWANPTAGTKALIMRKMADVVLTDSDNIKTCSPIGVLLGSVTKSGTATYCTWIQLYGYGLVSVTTGATNALNYLDALFSSSTAGVATTPGAVNLSSDSAGDSPIKIIGYSLQEVAVSTSAIIPAFICPGLRIPMF